MFQAGCGIKSMILVNCESVPTIIKCNRKQGGRGGADIILWTYNRKFGAPTMSNTSILISNNPMYFRRAFHYSGQICKVYCMTYIISECLDSVVIHCYGNNISSTPLQPDWCCVASEGSEFRGGKREFRNIIFKINKRTHITVITTCHQVPSRGTTKFN